MKYAAPMVGPIRFPFLGRIGQNSLAVPSEQAAAGARLGSRDSRVGRAEKPWIEGLGAKNA